MKRSLAMVAFAVGSVLAAGAAPIYASSPHNSALYTNNGCSWDGYHKYTNSSTSGSATADTEKKGGNCVEVHVRMGYNGTTSQDWDATKAIVSFTGSTSFSYSDHNADPLGPPAYVGFRIY